MVQHVPAVTVAPQSRTLSSKLCVDTCCNWKRVALWMRRVRLCFLTWRWRVRRLTIWGLDSDITLDNLNDNDFRHSGTTSGSEVSIGSPYSFDAWPALKGRSESVRLTPRCDTCVIWKATVAYAARNHGIWELSTQGDGTGSLVSTHTEIVLPMSWEGRTMWQERCGRTNIHFASLWTWRASDDWHCEHYTGRGVMKFRESGAALCRGYASACLEDVGIDWSSHSSFLGNSPGSNWRTVPSVS